LQLFSASKNSVIPAGLSPESEA